MNRQILIAVGLGALAAGLAYYYLSEKEAEIEAKTALVKVLAAKSPIKRGTMLSADKVAVIEMPAAYVMPGAVSAPSREDIVKAWKNYENQFAMVPIAKGEQVLPNKLSKIMPGFAGTVPEGMRIVSFSLPAAAAIGGHVKPGNRVDVLGTFTHQIRKTKRITTVTLVQDVLVTAVGSRTTADATGESSPAEGREPLVVSFALAPTDATRLTLAENEGRLKLSLRAQGDTDILKLPDQNLGTLLGPLMRVEKESIGSAPKRIEIIKGMLSK